MVHFVHVTRRCSGRHTEDRKEQCDVVRANRLPCASHVIPIREPSGRFHIVGRSRDVRCLATSSAAQLSLREASGTASRCVHLGLGLQTQLPGSEKWWQ